ncbi:hypothetical protein QTG56_25680 (plasmid) [Rossellomorea sp. AcN35-11]|nr:hypothetical protein [Rossellomorea aquimaris]WJV32007.1 hypothetical protein QTG56_25680 [Rossellomorea sp. AcN35-11]
MGAYKGGNVYLTSDNKKMIDELIEMYFVSISPDEETMESIQRLREKIEK